MYHTKIFEACKYSRVEGPIHREGESSLTQIWFEHKASQYSCFALKYTHYQIAELLFSTTFFVHRNCCRLFQRTFPDFFSVKLGIYCCRQADVNNFVSRLWGLSAVQNQSQTRSVCTLCIFDKNVTPNLSRQSLNFMTVHVLFKQCSGI